MTNRALGLLLSGAVTATLAGCAGMTPIAGIGPVRQEPGATIHQTYGLPSVEPVGKTVELQQRGDVAISVSTLPFTPKLYQRSLYKQLPTLIIHNDQYNYQVTTIPTWAVAPRALQFKIRVVNNQDDVLRLSGVLVRFNLDGKDYALDAESSGMKSLIDGVLAPQEQKEFTLFAAPAENLRDGANVSLRIYAVPTHSAQKGNFEWNYRVTVRQEAKDVQTTVRTESLTELEALKRQREQPQEI